MNRIEKLMAQMTLAEKVGQLTMTAAGHAVTGPVIAGDSTEAIKTGAIGNLLNLVGAGPVREMQRLAVEESRLKIPLLIGLDIIHGHRTLFPIPLAEAALFDPQTWELTAREAAKEGAADGLAMTFSPMLDVSRDIRWGRTAEGSGEDPWVSAQMARAKVRGYEGSDLASPDALAACAKHFCAYGPVLAGREYAPVDISERTLLEVHLPPFDAAVAAGVATIMPAFTDLDGTPMTANKELLRHHLREQLGFDGVLVSDYNAIAELMHHGIAADLPQAAALALDAGVDIDMMSDAYRRALPVALERGLVTMEQIDESVRRVLRLKERLGLFDDPYRRGSRPESQAALTHRRELARSVGARAIVMLKNDRETLPLRGTLRRVCVIGPLADAAAEMGGCWGAAGRAQDRVSVVAGLRQALPGAEIVHAAGIPFAGEDESGIASA
ncbi:MAG: glycoside hydrolase family 3 domain protein, partial [Gammaproteobacteria bacterium]|nr:glycoside hydrolase family 3 domain protein [Gammaproteobacteria bacterium]